MHTHTQTERETEREREREREDKTQLQTQRHQTHIHTRRREGRSYVRLMSVRRTYQDIYVYACIYIYVCISIYIYTLELFIPQTQRHKIQTLASHRLKSFSMEGGGGGGGMFIVCPTNDREGYPSAATTFDAKCASASSVAYTMREREKERIRHSHRRNIRCK